MLNKVFVFPFIRPCLLRRNPNLRIWPKLTRYVTTGKWKTTCHRKAWSWKAARRRRTRMHPRGHRMFIAFYSYSVHDCVLFNKTRSVLCSNISCTFFADLPSLCSAPITDQRWRASSPASLLVMWQRSWASSGPSWQARIKLRTSRRPWSWRRNMRRSVKINSLLLYRSLCCTRSWRDVSEFQDVAAYRAKGAKADGAKKGGPGRPASKKAEVTDDEDDDDDLDDDDDDLDDDDDDDE